MNRDDDHYRRRDSESLEQYEQRLRKALFDHPLDPQARARVRRIIRQQEHADDWPEQAPYVVYRNVWLEPTQFKSVLDTDDYEVLLLEAPPTIRMAVEFGGAHVRRTGPPLGYRREEHPTFEAAILAMSKSTAEIALERWTRDLLREHAQRVGRQRQARAAKFGRAETAEERNARHREAHAESGLSANKYAKLHDGEDSLSRHHLRRIVSPAGVAQKSRLRPKRKR